MSKQPPHKKFVRVKENDIPRVEFTSDLFAEGIFNMPSLDQAPFAVVANLQAGNLAPFNRWIRDNVDAETYEAIAELNPDDFNQFREEWQSADVIDAPKSIG